MSEYNPDYVPDGPNNRINEYYKKINHVRIAKVDSNRREFFGTIGGDPGIPGLLSKPAIVMQGEATGPYDTGVIIMEQEPVWDGNQISDQWVLQKNGVDILGTENIPEGGTYAIPDASVTEDDVFAILATATYAEDPFSREVQSDALIATIVFVPTLPTINNTSPTVGDTITVTICQAIQSNSPLTEKVVEWHDDGPDPILQQDFLNPSEPLDCQSQFTINAKEAGERIRAEMQVRNGVAPLAGAPVRSVSAWTDPVYAGDVPSITGVPTISGTAQLGQVLTANPAPVTGLPSPVRSWQWLRDGVPVSGSTSDSYALLTADIGAVMTVEQTETNTVGSDSAVSDPTSAVLDGPATNLTPPVATGNTSLGDVLTTTDGTWDNATGGAFSYQWQRGGGPIPTDIPGATSNTYTITLDDDDVGLRCMVTYTKPEGAASAPSNAILVDNFTIPVISGVPTISGSTVVGSLLTAQPSAVAATPASATTWQWHNATDGVIAGATSATYTVQASDSGDRLYVEQIETNALGSDTERSADTDVVTDTFILTVENTSEAPDITIPDGTNPDLAITFTIAGTPYTTDTGATTLTVGGIQAAPMNIIKPTISGDPVENATWTLERGYYLYAGPENIIFTEAWINEIDGALGETGFTYLTTSTDLGDTLRVDETVQGDEGGFAPFIIASDSSPAIGGGLDPFVTLDADERVSQYFAAPSENITSNDFVETIELATAADDRDIFVTLTGSFAADINVELDINGSELARVGVVERGGPVDLFNRAASYVYYTRSSEFGGPVTVTSRFNGMNRQSLAYSAQVMRNTGPLIIEPASYGASATATVQAYTDGFVFGIGTTNAGDQGSNWSDLTVYTVNGDVQIGGIGDFFIAANDLTPTDDPARTIIVSNPYNFGTAWSAISAGPDDAASRVHFRRRWFASNGFPGSGIGSTPDDDTVTVDLGTARAGRRFVIVVTAVTGRGDISLTIDGVSATSVQAGTEGPSTYVKAFYLDSDTIGGNVDIVSSGWTSRLEVAYSIYDFSEAGTITAYIGQGDGGATATNNAVNFTANGNFMLSGISANNEENITTVTGPGLYRQRCTDIRTGEMITDGFRMSYEGATNQTVSVAPNGGTSTTLWIGLDIAPA